MAFHGASGRWIWWLDLHLAAAAAAGREAEIVSRAEEAGGSVALEAALARADDLFGSARRSRRSVPCSRRAGIISRIGAASEGERAGRRSDRLRRWVVAALAVDRPASLGTVFWDVARRELSRRREPATRSVT